MADSSMPTTDPTEQPINLKFVLLLVGVLAPFVTAALAWERAVARVDSIETWKLDASRFVSDSIRRDADREILLRLDRRTRAMYCDRKPPGCE